jgi:hypothetical protein
MGHHITAIILQGDYVESTALKYDLVPVKIGYELTMFHIDHYYSAYWQYKLGLSGQLNIGEVDAILFPSEIAIAELIAKISTNTQPRFAIIQTDYFAGLGSQNAAVFLGSENPQPHIRKINQALSFLGSKCTEGLDEFDTAGLSHHRTQPEYLEKYQSLAEDAGL